MITIGPSIWDIVEHGHSGDLVDNGKPRFDLNVIHPEYGTPLAHAIRTGRGNVVFTLLQHRPWLTFEFPNGDSLLHLAVRYATRSEIAALLEAGHPVDVQNRNHETPLHFAAIFNKPAAAAELLSRLADPRLLTVDGKPASHLAIEHHHLSVARVIMDNVPRLIPDAEERTEIHVGCAMQLADFVAYLCKRFDDVNRPDRNRQFPLHAAAKAGAVASASILLGSGARRDVVDALGRSPGDLLGDLKPAIRVSMMEVLAQ